MIARPTLLLSGFMGTGKSTVGPLVASLAATPFVDLDTVIVEVEKQSIAQIFVERGESGFREMEARALTRILEDPGPKVVALGGGTLLDTRTRRAALARARVITLTARLSTIVARTSAPGRPLLDEAGDRAARARELLATRSAAYAESHGRVATDDLAPEEVAATVLRLWTDDAVAVPLGARGYAVRIASDAPAATAELAALLEPTAVFVVTDATVHRLAGAAITAALEARGLRVHEVTPILPGEESKQLGTLERLLTEMVTGGADRSALVVGLGGGVVTDLAGFAASTLLRGVPWIAVPTTLLAMVDASVGGKTGVDLGAAKNAVGAFHQPAGVIVGPAFVATETARAYTSGLAEVVKSAAVGDPALFQYLEREVDAVTGREPAAVRRMVAGSIRVKAAIVARDEREGGERALLNFGHTVGHALEAEGGFVRLTHGEAVSLGMVAALRVGERLGITPPAETARVVALLGRLGLPVDLDAQPLSAALPFIGLDKKRRGDSLRVILLETVGALRPHSLPLTRLCDVLTASH